MKSTSSRPPLLRDRSIFFRSTPPFKFSLNGDAAELACKVVWASGACAVGVTCANRAEAAPPQCRSALQWTDTSKQCFRGSGSSKYPIKLQAHALFNQSRCAIDRFRIQGVPHVCIQLQQQRKCGFSDPARATSPSAESFAEECIPAAFARDDAHFYRGQAVARRAGCDFQEFVAGLAIGGGTATVPSTR